MNLRSITAVGILTVAVFGLAGCGDDSDTATDGSDATTTTETAGPTISGAWARNSPMEATNGAAYLVVKGGATDDAVVAASVDAGIAGKVELHETVMASSDAMGSTTMPASGDAMSSTTLAPAMEMRPVESIPVPAGETVELEPGGLHIMLLDLAKPLEVGDTFDLTVTFEQAGEQVVSVEVKDAA